MKVHKHNAQPQALVGLLVLAHKILIRATRVAVAGAYTVLYATSDESFFTVFTGPLSLGPRPCVGTPTGETRERRAERRTNPRTARTRDAYV